MSVDKIADHIDNRIVFEHLNLIRDFGKVFFGKNDIDQYAGQMSYSEFPQNISKFEKMLLQMEENGDTWDNDKWSNETATYKR